MVGNTAFFVLGKGQRPKVWGFDPHSGPLCSEFPLKPVVALSDYWRCLIWDDFLPFIKLSSTHSCVIFGFSVFHSLLLHLSVHMRQGELCTHLKRCEKRERREKRDSASLFRSHFFTIAPHLKAVCLVIT